MKNVDKVNKVKQFYINKVIPLAFDESLSYYECICNIANHINKVIIPIVEEDREIVYELNNSFNELKQYVDDNMLTIDTDELVNYYDKNETDDLLDNKANVSDIPDLTDYVKNTDYATVSKGGVIKISTTNYGYSMESGGYLQAYPVSYNDYLSRVNQFNISKGTLENVITGKGLVSNTNYASSSVAGVVKAGNNAITVDSSGNLRGVDLTYTQYTNAGNIVIIDKGTLENVLTTRLAEKENVIATGSNANGNYIKFDNGDMICYQTQDLGKLDYSTSFGAIYWTGQVHSWTFPAEFISPPSFVIPSVYTTTISGANLQSIPTTTGATCFIYCFTSSASRSTLLQWIAIGKWK